MFGSCDGKNADRNAMLLAVLSGFFLSFYGLLYEIIKDDIARSTVTVTRGITQVSTNLFVAFCIFRQSFGLQNREEIPADSSPRKIWAIFLLLILCGGTRMCFLFSALQLLNISLVHTILNGNPVLVMIMGHFILKDSEKLTWIKIASGFILLIGICLTSDPYEAIVLAVKEHNYESAIGISLAICGLFVSALSNIITKMIGRFFTRLQISGFIGASIAICALIIVPLDPFVNSLSVMKTNYQFLEKNYNDNTTAYLGNMDLLEPYLEEYPMTNITCVYDKSNYSLALNLAPFSNATFEEDFFLSCATPPPPYFPNSARIWITNIIIAIFGVGQQFCLIAAITMGSPTKVTMVRSVSVIFSFILESIYYSVPSWNQWVGAAFVIAAIFLNALEKPIKKKHNEFKESILKAKQKDQQDNGIMEKLAE